MAVARVEAALHETSLRTALEAWLYRTPIQGSHPGDPGDDDVVVRFVGEYLDGIERAQSAQLARLVEAGSQEPAALSQRFADGLARAAQFLRAEDVAAEDRERRRRVRAALLFIESYRDLPLLAWPRLLVDSVVELEELLVLWRNRHARMVERVIGRRVGTGGSAGVDYLDQTAKMRIFQDLWTVRTVLLARDAVPPLQEPGRYGFATG
jgi:tryptophan 2,3-dioxygenase